MFGFLLKIVIIAAIVTGIGSVIVFKGGSITNLSQLPSEFKSTLAQVDTNTLWSNVNSTLDSLVTNPNSSPVVLGVKITNDTLNTAVDALYKLPPDQLEQIRSAICTPLTPTVTATPSPTIKPLTF